MRQKTASKTAAGVRGKRASAAADLIGLGPLRLPAAPLRRARRRAKADLDTLKRLTESRVARFRGIPRQQGAAPPGADRRPDGSVVSPGLSLPANVTPAGRQNPAKAEIVAAKGILGALQSRWNEALREGRRAARAKEAEIRSDYNLRVRHNPRPGNGSGGEGA